MDMGSVKPQGIIGDYIEAKRRALALRENISEEIEAVKAQDQTKDDLNKTPGDVYIEEIKTYPEGDVAKKVYEFRSKTTQNGADFYRHEGSVGKPNEPEEKKFRESYTAELTDKYEKYEHTLKTGSNNSIFKDLKQQALFFDNHTGRYTETHGSETTTVDFKY